MRSLFEDYSELVKLTEKYLDQEHKRTDWIYSGKETYTYFREYARQQKTASPAVPAVPSKPVPVQQSFSTPPVPPPFVPKILTSSEPSILNKENLKEGLAHTAKSAVQNTSENEQAPAETKSLTLSPLPPPKPDDLSDLYQHIQKNFPNIQLLKDIPSDEKAREFNKESFGMKPSSQVILLTYHNDEPTATFLENIAQAIRGLGVSCSLLAASPIEQAQGWEEFLKKEDLKLIISNHHGLHSLPSLTRHLKEMDRQGKQYLGKIPLCLLADVTVYQKDPKLKVPLWQSIKSLLGK